MDRILQGTPAPISVTFASAGTPVDPTPASVSVTITRADGTVLVGHLDSHPRQPRACSATRSRRRTPPCLTG
jgi:hypothetical protein